MEVLRPGWAVKAIVVIIITSVLFRCVSATNYSVGGSTGWDLASDLRTWSAAATFHVDDSLVFTYSPLHDVLEVNESDFESCRISQPIDAHRDGNTIIQLRQTGTRYFICGRLGHCNMGLKLQVLVLPQLVTNATNAGSDGSGNVDDDDYGSGEGAGRSPRGRRPKHSPPHGKHSPPPGKHSPPPPKHSSPPPKHSPPPVSLPPLPPWEPVPSTEPTGASPGTASEAPHLEAAGSLNWWFLPLNTLLMMISFWPRETLRFLFTFYVL